MNSHHFATTGSLRSGRWKLGQLADRWSGCAQMRLIFLGSERALVVATAALGWWIPLIVTVLVGPPK
ncbi:hypothetical protein DCC24_01320 [Auritidibacter sp. NML100628]|nr:hypothetical protein DCC24_01320 [Auritidibacter sp. NML100628]